MISGSEPDEESESGEQVSEDTQMEDGRVTPPPPWNRPEYELPGEGRRVTHQGITWHHWTFPEAQDNYNTETDYFLLSCRGRYHAIMLTSVYSWEGRQAGRHYFGVLLGCHPDEVLIFRLTREVSRRYGVETVFMVTRLPSMHELRGGNSGNASQNCSVASRRTELLQHHAGLRGGAGNVINETHATISPTEPYWPADSGEGAALSVESMSADSRKKPTSPSSDLARVVIGRNYGQSPRLVHGVCKQSRLYGACAVHVTTDDNETDGDGNIPPTQPELVLRLLVMPSGKTVLIRASESMPCGEVLERVSESVPLFLSGRFEVTWQSPYVGDGSSWGYALSVSWKLTKQYKGGMERQDEEDLQDLVEALEEDVNTIAALLVRVQRQVRELRERSGLAERDRRAQQVNEAPQEISSEEEQQQDEFLVSVRAGPRARITYPFYYFRPHSLVHEVHFEYARISRRGALTFHLTQWGQPLLGWVRLDTLIQGEVLEAPRFLANDQQEEEPLSSCDEPPRMWRGGSPSKIRAAVARKISQCENPPPEGMALVQKLWTLAPDEVTSLQGNPNQVASRVNAMVKKFNLAHTAMGWQIQVSMPSQSPKREDPWTASDPWSKARPSTFVAHDSLEQAKASEFERSEVVTKFVDDKAVEIPLVRRWDSPKNSPAIMLIAPEHLEAVMTAWEGLGPVVAIMDKLPTNPSTRGDFRHAQPRSFLSNLGAKNQRVPQIQRLYPR